MKFLLDAQLPPSLKVLFSENGYDCIHTIDLEQGNDTSDTIINKISVDEQRILITKDSDFFDSFLVKKELSCPKIVYSLIIKNWNYYERSAWKSI